MLIIQLLPDVSANETVHWGSAKIVNCALSILFAGQGLGQK